MIHAYCNGMDISGDTSNPLWWKKLAIVSDYAARTLRSQMFLRKYDFNLALLSYENEPSAFKLHHEQANYLRNNIANELMPWVDTGPKTLREAMARMRQQYDERFADPSSEKGRAAVAEQLRIWKEKHREHARSKLSKRKLHRKSAS